MRKDNRINGGMAAIAAVTVIMQFLSQVISNVETLLRASQSGAMGSVLMSLGGSLVTAVLFVVVLLRKKKDPVAGVILLILTAGALLSAVLNTVTVLKVLPNMGSYRDNYETYAVLNGTAAFLNVVFRVILAVECFNPGKIARSLMLILPWARAFCAAFSTIMLSAGDMSIRDPELMGWMVTSAMATAVLSVSPVMCGLAFMVPVYEEKYN